MSTHDGHRERLRNKFLCAPSALEDHELLELLLFYAVPRVNTNEIAHRLLESFGSIKGVLDAGIPALTNVAKIGDKSALFMRVVSETLSRYELCETKSINPLVSPAALGKYMRSLFVGTDKETTYLLLFDATRCLISCSKISEGYSVGNVISIREITTLSITSNAASALLVHNHPNGKPIPSGDDISTTNAINMSMNLYGVEFIDHFIVAENKCVPIIHSDIAPLYNM